MDLQELISDKCGTLLHVSTIRKQRKIMGYEAVRPVKIPFIRQPNQVKRLAFCHDLTRTGDTFHDVIFTDESSVQVGNNSTIAIAKVTRDSTGKVITKDMPIFSKLKHPLKVHVWGGISRNGATQVKVFCGNMNAEFYTDEILRDTLLPAIAHLYPQPLTHRLWQDNDPKHTSIRARNFMEENAINWFKTPPESPDLNVIENVWSSMKRYVSKEHPRTQDALVATIIRFWNSHLTVEQCNRYINHIYRVIPKVIEAEGGYSGY